MERRPVKVPTFLGFNLHVFAISGYVAVHLKTETEKEGGEGEEDRSRYIYY
jgi:hypothetical protein